MNPSGYKQVKIVGFILLIPIILGVGPLTGYFFGAYIARKFHLGYFVVFISFTLGFLAAVQETIKILKLVTKIENE